MKVTRERSSGPNIFDVSRTIVSMNVDGTVKKTVKNQTFMQIFRSEKRGRLVTVVNAKLLGLE